MLPVIIGLGAGALFLLKKLHAPPPVTRTVIPTPVGPVVAVTPAPVSTKGQNVGGKTYHIAPGDSGARVWGRFLPALPNHFMAANPGIADWVHFTGVSTIILPPNAVDKGPAPMATGIVT